MEWLLKDMILKLQRFRVYLSRFYKCFLNRARAYLMTDVFPVPGAPTLSIVLHAFGSLQAALKNDSTDSSWDTLNYETSPLSLARKSNFKDEVWRAQDFEELGSDKDFLRETLGLQFSWGSISAKILILMRVINYIEAILIDLKLRENSYYCIKPVWGRGKSSWRCSTDWKYPRKPLLPVFWSTNRNSGCQTILFDKGLFALPITIQRSHFYFRSENAYALSLISFCGIQEFLTSVIKSSTLFFKIFPLWLLLSNEKNDFSILRRLYKLKQLIWVCYLSKVYPSVLILTT